MLYGFHRLHLLPPSACGRRACVPYMPRQQIQKALSYSWAVKCAGSTPEPVLSVFILPALRDAATHMNLLKHPLVKNCQTAYARNARACKLASPWCLSCSIHAGPLKCLLLATKAATSEPRVRVACSGRSGHNF